MNTKASEAGTTGRLASEALSWAELKRCVDAHIVWLLELEVNGIEFGSPESLFVFLPSIAVARD